MAPSSDAASTTALQGLASAVTIPQRVSLRGQTTSALMDIEYVVVRRSSRSRGLRGCYTVEMFESASKSRIPTMQRSTQARTALSFSAVTGLSDNVHRPRGSIERQYDEFVEMRGKIFNYARHAHFDDPCAFCTAVLEEIVFGGSKPGTLLKLLGSEEKISVTLTKSTNSLLAIIKGGGAIHNCSGQDGVRRVLFDFFYTRDSETS